MLNRSSYGDLLVTVIGEMPKSLNKQEKQLLTELGNNFDETDFARFKQYKKDMNNL